MTNDQPICAYICMIKDLGVGGNLFGGVMLAWMDEAAGIYAHRVTGGQRLVTLGYSSILFRRPVREWELVEFLVHDAKIGRTSLTFGLEGRVGGEVVFDTVATVVAIDEAGRPTPIRTQNGRVD